MKEAIAKGSTGILATVGGFSISLVVVNGWLQTISLIVGIAVGIATLVSLLRKKKPTNKQ